MHTVRIQYSYTDFASAWSCIFLVKERILVIFTCVFVCSEARHGSFQYEEKYSGASVPRELEHTLLLLSPYISGERDSLPQEKDL